MKNPDLIVTVNPEQPKEGIATPTGLMHIGNKIESGEPLTLKEAVNLYIFYTSQNQSKLREHVIKYLEDNNKESYLEILRLVEPKLKVKDYGAAYDLMNKISADGADTLMIVDSNHDGGQEINKAA